MRKFVERVWLEARDERYVAHRLGVEGYIWSAVVTGQERRRAPADQEVNRLEGLTYLNRSFGNIYGTSIAYEDEHSIYLLNRHYTNAFEVLVTVIG